MSIGLYIVLAPLYLKSVRKLQEKRFVFVKILAIIIPENGAKVSKIKCFQFAQQTLSIFLDNAVSYSKENSNIEILTSQTSKEFTFLVVDHGCGIAEKDKPFIFDRFYCADKSRTNKAHFGLGLSIAKELAKMLSGKIGFSDTSGGGTTFFLTLPIK